MENTADLCPQSCRINGKNRRPLPQNVPNKCVSNLESSSRQDSFVRARFTRYHWIRREILHQLGTLTLIIALDMDSGELCVDRTMRLGYISWHHLMSFTLYFHPQVANWPIIGQLAT